MACALLLVACAGLDGMYSAQIAGGDYWNTSLVLAQRIEVAALTDADSGRPSALSGIISAVAAQGDDLYFIDTGSAVLVHVSLAAMSARTLASLPGVNSGGLYASSDGSVYVADSYNRQILRLDPMLGELDRFALGHFLGSPADLTLVESERSLLVLDALDGRIAVLDVLGGLQQLIEPQFFDPAAVSSATAIAAGTGEIFLLDSGVDAVAGISHDGFATGNYGDDDLQRVTAFAVDSCRRLFVADAYDGGLYIGTADMSLPGRRVEVPALAGTEIADLWTDEAFLFVATRSSGIFVFAVDPVCAF